MSLNVIKRHGLSAVLLRATRFHKIYPSQAIPTHTMFTARVLPADLQCDVEDGMTLLQALEAGRIEIPSSCRNGTCRTCVCQLLQGSVRYEVEWPGLSTEEMDEGYVLPCVAFATSDVVLQQESARGT
jgi:ferredoxin